MNSLRLSLLVSLFVIRHSSFVIAQGPLTPPGAPAPTQRTLDEVEARTPISSAPFTISAGGSYYLTRNLAVTAGDAIVIDTENVTLDLNGFTLSSTASPASGTAINFGTTAPRNITIRNGVIRGATTFTAGTFTTGGFLHGIRAIAFGGNVRVSDLRILGMAQTGIDLNTVRTYAVERCLVEVCGTLGIRVGQVRDCSATTCGTDAITGILVRDSFGESVGAGATDQGIAATIAINCTGVAAGGTGIFTTLATSCEGTSTGNLGVAATGTASFCRGKHDGGIAISATSGAIAIGCTVNGTGSVNSSKKFLGTP